MIYFETARDRSQMMALEYPNSNITPETVIQEVVVHEVGHVVAKKFGRPITRSPLDSTARKYTKLFIFIFIACSVFGPAAISTDGKTTDVGIQLATPRECWLVGEPVLLDVAVENFGQSEVLTRKVLSDELEAQCIYIAREGGPYKQLILRALGYSPRGPKAFRPGECWMYRIRALYSPRGRDAVLTRDEAALILPGGKAFKEPGTYSVKVVVPLLVEGARDIEPIESNEITIRIVRPEGIDAEVYSRIKTDEVLQFLQLGDVREGEEEIVLRVIKLVEAHPETGYRDALRHALRHFYGDWPRLPQEDWERIRTILELPEQADNFYPKDERLDRLIFTNGKKLSIAQALESISRQARVRLEAAGDVGRGPFRIPKGAVDLRTMMQDLEWVERGRWFRSGDDYVLWSLEEVVEEARAQQQN